MANWDHKSNVGTHPVLDPDAGTALIAKIEAAAYQAARHDAHMAQLVAQYVDLAPQGNVHARIERVFAARAAKSRGRRRVLEQVATGTLP